MTARKVPIPQPDEIKLDKFMGIYREKLLAAIRANPENYAWPVENIDKVVNQTRLGLVHNSFNKNTKAFRDTCKELEIPNTIVGITTFLGG